MTIKSYQASSAIPAYSFVKFNDEKSIKAASVATDNIIGVTDSTNTTENDIADVFMPGEIALILAGGTFSAGDALTSDENGYAIKADAGDNIGAVALQDAVSGDIIQAIVTINRTFETSNTNEGGDTTPTTTPNGTSPNSETSIPSGIDN